MLFYHIWLNHGSFVQEVRHCINAWHCNLAQLCAFQSKAPLLNPGIYSQFCTHLIN